MKHQSVAVHEIMLEHLKEGGRGQTHKRAGTALEALQPWVMPRWSRLASEGTVAVGKATRLEQVCL